MKNKKYTLLSTLFAVLLTSIVLSSCKDSQSPGVEYMPDMYRSSAVEGYWDYAEVQGKFDQEAYDLIKEKYIHVYVYEYG